MSIQRLIQARRKSIGTKQTIKAVQNDLAIIVYVAQEAESRVIGPLLQLCAEKGLEVVKVTTMAELGAACGIEVGSASAAILTE